MRNFLFCSLVFSTFAHSFAIAGEPGPKSNPRKIDVWESLGFDVAVLPTSTAEKQVFDVSWKDASAEDAASAPDPGSPFSLHIPRDAADPDPIASLVRWPSLRNLDLVGRTLSRRDLERIARLPALESIGLIGCKFVPADLRLLKDAAKLHTLRLTDPRDFAPEMLSALGSLKQLRRIDLSIPSMRETDLQRLSGMTLHALDIDERLRTDAGLEQVVAALDPTIESMDLTNWSITDRSLALLRRFVNLRELDLTQTGLTDEGLRHLEGMPKLARISLPARATDQAMKTLATLPALQEIDAERTAITEEGLKVLVGRNLKRVSLPVQARTDRGLRHWVGCLDPDLAEIELGDWLLSDEAFSELRRFRWLKSLAIRSTRYSKEALKHLVGLRLTRFEDDSRRFTNEEASLLIRAFDPQIEQLSLTGDKLTDRAVRELATLPKLKKLSLEGANEITDAGMEALARLPHLEELHLTSPHLTDRSFRIFAESRTLRSLHLESEHFTENCFKPLAGKNYLDLLTPAAARNGVGLRHLAAALDPNRTSLELRGWDLADGDLEVLYRFRKLTSLNLPSEQILGHGLAALGDLKLDFFEVPAAARNDLGLQHFARVSQPEITQLELRGWKITDASLAQLQRFRKLRTLNLDETGITDEGVAALAGMNLRQLRLPLQALTNTGLKNMVRALDPRCRELSLLGFRVESSGIESLRRFPRLRQLDLSGVQLDADAWKAVASLRSLQSLHLQGSNLDDAALEHLASLPELRELELSGTASTAKGLRVLRRAKSLRTLHLSEELANEEGRKALQGMKLAHLHVPIYLDNDAGVE
jgi:Leucine-rich repeat (LRR) protein